MPPREPAAARRALQEELDRLREVVNQALSDAEKARQAAEMETHQRWSAEERARKESEDRALWEQLAVEADQANKTLTAQLASLQAASEHATPQTTVALVAQAAKAAAEIDIDEASTRVIIDEHLRARGWEVDTSSLRYAAGARPVKGRNRAIAEWPTNSGPADYGEIEDAAIRKITGSVDQQRPTFKA